MWINKYYPITTTMGLIKADIDIVSQAYANWMDRVFSGTGIYIEQRDLKGSINDIVMSLPPLTTPISTKSVFIKTYSEWIVYFDNHRVGTDPEGVMRVLSEELKCVSRLVTVVPPPVSKAPSDFRYPGNRIDYYDESGKCTRSISAINDGGSWAFDQVGQPLQFEEVDKYFSKRVKDRLTVEMITSYLAHEGVHPFEPNWFCQEAHLFTKKGGYIPKKIMEYPLPESHAKV